MVHFIFLLGLSVFCVQATDSSQQKPNKSVLNKIKGRFSKSKKPFSEPMSSVSSYSEDEGNTPPATGSHNTNSQESPNFPPSQRDKEFIQKMEGRLPPCAENIQIFNEVASGEYLGHISEAQKKQMAEYRDFLIIKYRTLFDRFKNNPLPLNNQCEKEASILGPFHSRLLEGNKPSDKAGAAADRKLKAELALFKKNRGLYKAPTRTQRMKMAVNNKLGR